MRQLWIWEEKGLVGYWGTWARKLPVWVSTETNSCSDLRHGCRMGMERTAGEPCKVASTPPSFNLCWTMVFSSVSLALVLTVKEAELAERSIRAERLSVESLLAHTIYVRNRARLTELKTIVQERLKLGGVEAALHGS